jgi:hypothetical protein
MKNKQSFEDWMKKVDCHIEYAIGLSTSDLPDCCYRDWYDNGMSAKAAAAKAIRYAND